MDRTRVDTSRCDRGCNRRPAWSRKSRASPVRQRAARDAARRLDEEGHLQHLWFGGTGLGRTTVRYESKYASGTIVINTAERWLYLIQENGSALRYGIGVGRVGFQWKGTHKITAKKEFPDWTAPPEIRARQRDVPARMKGGDPDNPLGTRAMYLGSTLYRIHGSNDPDSVGEAESSGCFRMRNEDVADLYKRVSVGTTVVVK